jgi:biopolymer transport protein ExbD
MDARRAARKAKRATPTMNVTPLVDVVLVLLIIFMVVIPAMQNGARIELPSIFHVDEEQRGRADPIQLALTSDGQLFLDREHVPPAELQQRLDDLHERDVMRRIVLRADRGVHYEKARDLFALCQRIGFPGISLQVNERAQDHHASAPPQGH